MWRKLNHTEQNSPLRLFHVWVRIPLSPPDVKCIVQMRVITLDRT